MKRKFFSLMVAACAALFSVSGLTGCGGGGGEEGDTYGVVSLNDFANGRKSFSFQFSSSCKLIAPETKSDQMYELPQGSTYVKVDGCTFYAGTKAIPADVTYYVDWADGAPYPTDGASSENGGTGTYLYISLDSAYYSDTHLLAALGLSTTAGIDSVSGPLTVGLQFANNRCDYTVPYKHNAEAGKPAEKPDQVQDAQDCPLYAVKGN